MVEGTRADAVVLAATDPANPYGAALPWPERVVESADGEPVTASGHRAGRKAGALVIVVDGALAVYVERGGRTLLSYVDDPETLAAAAKALAARGFSVGSVTARCPSNGPTATRSTPPRCGTRSPQPASGPPRKGYACADDDHLWPTVNVVRPRPRGGRWLRRR